MIYQGIVIKMMKNKAIVTTSDFQCFYIKRRPTTYIGMEVEFTEKDIVLKRPVLRKVFLSAACIAALFIIASFLNIIDLPNGNNTFSDAKVFAYVDVDINPSLEMEIDDIGNVLRVVPLNEEAESIVEKLEVDKTSVYKVMDSIIDEVKKNKLISESEKNYVLVSSTLSNNKNEDDKDYQVEKKKLDNIIDSLKYSIQENDKVDVYLVQANESERKDAQSKGISTGRYVLYNKYKSLNSSYSIEEVKNTNVNELLSGILKDNSEIDSLKSAPKLTTSPLKTEKEEPTKDPAGKKTEMPSKAPATKQPTTRPTITITTPTIKSSAPTLTSTPRKVPVTIYKDANYGGKAVELGVGEYTMFELMDKGLMNDEASSIKVAPGYRVTLYEDYDFSGKTLVLTGDDKNLADNGFDNIVSAVKVELSTAKSSPAKYINSLFMRFESYNYGGQFIRHEGFEGRISPDASPLEDSVFKIVPGLADTKCISFESKNYPGYYLTHENYKIVLRKVEKSDVFKKSATFRKVPGLGDKDLVSFQSFNYPNRYIRHVNFYLQIDEIVTELEKKDATFIEVKVE